jgi:hypothetical protein
MDWPGQLDQAREIDIETRRGEDAPAHRVTIWVVVDGHDVFVRSYHGPEGRWYRRKYADSSVVDAMLADELLPTTLKLEPG